MDEQERKQRLEILNHDRKHAVDSLHKPGSETDQLNEMIDYLNAEIDRLMAVPEEYLGSYDPASPESKLMQKAMSHLGKWEVVRMDNGVSYQRIRGKDCEVTLEKRPHYCDRGNWYAKVQVWNPMEFTVDHADSFPRYYFQESTAKIEMIMWLTRRGQLES